MMNSDYKNRVRKSIESFSIRNNGLQKRKKTNNNIEGPVVLEILNYLKLINWSVDIVEAKGVYNESAGRYLHGKTRPGFSDICGNMPNGIAIWIEVKAPGKRKTIRVEQYQFLIEKISSNCFAIVCDGIDYFKYIFNEWIISNNKKATLLNELPQLPKKLNDNDLKW